MRENVISMNWNSFVLKRNRDKQHGWMIFKVTIIGIVAMFMTSCNGDNKDDTFPKITHLAFQTEKDGKWGLIGVDGKVLFEDKFTERPSYAVNGVFRIREYNSQEGIDVYKYFIASEEPKQLGDPEGYVAGGLFSEGLLPVASLEGRVHYLTATGDTAFWLNPYNGKEIILVSPFFSDKRAWFMLENTKYGFIDTNGHVVIEPIYDRVNPFHDGKAIVYREDRKVYVAIDTNGKELFEVSGDAPSSSMMLKPIIANNYCVLDNFICNEKGERIQRLPEVLSISPFVDSVAMFQNDKYVWRQIDLNGKLIGNAQYQCALGMMDNITYVGNIVSTLDDGNNRINVSALNKKGEELYRIENLLGFFPLYNNIVICEDNKCYFADKNGVPINNDTYAQIVIPSYTSVPGYPLVYEFLTSSLQSLKECYKSGGVLASYVDEHKIVGSILNKITKDGFGKARIGQKAEEIIRMKNIKDLRGWISLGVEKGINGVYADYEVILLPEWYSVCTIHIKLNTDLLPLKKDDPRIGIAIQEYFEKELGFKKREGYPNLYMADGYSYDIRCVGNDLFLIDKTIVQDY